MAPKRAGGKEEPWTLAEAGRGMRAGWEGGGLRDGAEPGWCSFTVGSMKRLG